MGYQNYMGYGCEKDHKESFRNFSEYLEKITSHGKNHLAQKNLSYCHYMLALHYHYGYSVEVNHKLSFEHYQHSVNLNNTRAMNNIGRMYEDGLYIEKKPSKSN
eukprot:TRINITY_DN14705_c0_g1_i1.p1 TRINITY_DN14705_c0_g1~~TRINITY_DN14705_c0_g1_i1.p1  ORF type:complete len:104 (+),score=18.23 TRINITY_DN14705_c0_g1_i1:67-378(+)